MYLGYELRLKEGAKKEDVPISLFTGDIEYQYGLMFRSMPGENGTIKIQFFTIVPDRYQFRTVEMPPDLRKTFQQWFEIKQINWYESLEK